MMTATAIQIRAMRKLGFICVAPVLGGGVGNISVTVRDAPMFGRNLPFAKGDSVLLFWEGNPAKRDDDQWLPGLISSAPAGACTKDPNPATPGWVLSLQPQWLNNNGLNIAGAVTTGSPVRAFEIVRYQVYQSASDGKWYVGYQNISAGGFASIQPLIGPLTGSDGLELDYFDVNGAVTTDSSKVALIEIHLRAQTAAPVRSGGALGTLANKVDSITTRVALRNNPRCGTGSAPFVKC